MDRLELRRQILNQRLEQQRLRINQRIEKQQSRLAGTLNARQEHIIATALEILAEDGLENVSVREIAKRLNIKAPSLYWHFKNKEALVDYMAEAILKEQFAQIQPRADDQPWDEWLLDIMVQLRKAMLAYPDGGRVVAGANLYPAVTLGDLFETIMASLTSAGLRLQLSRTVAMTVIDYTFGYVIEEQAAPSSEEVESLESVHRIKTRYPLMIMAMQEAHSHYKTDSNTDFIAGLQLILRAAQTITSEQTR